MSILVIGSLSIDNTFYVPALPARGETTIATSALTSFGGKGANQALAALSAGGDVSFLCCVGNDSAGKEYGEELIGQGFERSSIIVDGQLPTGSAYLSVEQSGENSIIINPGSNHALRPEHLEENIHLFKQSGMLLLQLELPLDTIRHACRLAREHQVTILINPSPWCDDFNTVDFPCDILVMNEHEAAFFSGEKQIRLAPGLLQDHQLETIIVTQGSGPTLALSRSQDILELNPPGLTPVDTVGAGDAFTGALAVALSEGKPLSAALCFANAAGALSITRQGAQGAIANRKEIESFLSSRSG
jgi:ribokinase